MGHIGWYITGGTISAILLALGIGASITRRDNPLERMSSRSQRESVSSTSSRDSRTSTTTIYQ